MRVPNTPFSTRLSGSAKETELRLRSIFQWKKKRPPVVLFILTVAALLACFGLVSCETEKPEGEEQSVADVMPSPEPEPETSEQETLDSTLTEKADKKPLKIGSEVLLPNISQEEDTEYTAAALPAYQKIISGLMQEVKQTGGATLPDGVSRLGFRTGTDHLEENLFAVTDIDGDGRVELLFRYLSTVESAHTEYIFEYIEGSGAVQQKYSTSPGSRYYDNGLIVVLWGSEAGSISLWPYGLIQYHFDKKEYGDFVVDVSSWNKGVQPREYEYYEAPFPDLVDLDGDGVVYIVRIRKTAAEPFDDQILDRVEYEQWHAAFFAGTTEIIPDWNAFTEENIARMVEEGKPQEEQKPSQETKPDVPDEAPMDAYERNKRLATIDGISHMPLDELPQEVLDSLTLVSESDLSGTYNAEWGWRRVYTAPGLKVITTAPSAAYLKWREAVDKNNRAMFPTEADFYTYIEGEEGREWLVNVTITDDKFATLDGLRVGMTCAQAEMLGYSLKNGRNAVGNTEIELDVVVENDTVVQMTTWWTMGRYIGKFFEL